MGNVLAHLSFANDIGHSLKSKGIAGYQKGDYLAAKTYLVDAAECLVELAESAKTDEARRQHEELATEQLSPSVPDA